MKNKHPKKILSILVLLLSGICFSSFSGILSTTSENSYPQDYFRSPLAIPIVLAGTFGELRNNHFHAGIDIKTQGREGHKILAVADGFVSRVKVSPYGYGCALYIDHPNGYTSVYGHLQKYSPKLQEYIKKTQYERQSYGIDLKLEPGLFEFKKGETVAFSGNTGGSSAPHLHFEIRETLSEHPLNPLLFGLKVPDKRKPILQQIAFYGIDTNNKPNDQSHKQAILGSGMACKLAKDTVKLNSETIGISIKSYDQQDGANNKNGVYKIKMFADEVAVFQFTAERLPFDEMRYINAHCDYKEWHNNRSWFNKCFKEPGNFLSAYKDDLGNGQISLSEGESKNIRIEVTDLTGNKSQVKFVVKNDPKGLPFSADPAYVETFYQGNINYFMQENISITLPDSALYNDINFNFKEKDGGTKSPYTPIYSIHNSSTPIHKPFELSINSGNLPEQKRSQAVVLVEYKKKKIALLPKYWDGPFLVTESKTFGDFYVQLDENPPKISPVYTYKDRNIGSYDLIRFTISDDLAGIQSYEGKLDGEWVLMEYEPKARQLRHYFEKDLPKGSHHFELIVRDGCNNENSYEFDFKR